MRDRQQQSLTNLLFERQFAPCSKRTCSQSTSEQSTRCIDSWAEGDSLKRCSATYCQLTPPPRSTIAAAFSPDGKLVASTHGDHTVKVICVRTGKCLQTLTGHRRTPWVVRFHPSSSSLLASGSLDYEVRLWNAHTAECINVHNFGRPIASLAFHIEGDALAVASGHKLYMWQYTKQQQGEEGAPPVALKTRRSLRAVHFHPLGLPLVLTAEVNDVSAPVTLPFGVTAPPPPPSPPQSSTPAPEPSFQGRVPQISKHSELDARHFSHNAFTSGHASFSQAQQDDWAAERRPPRRLSEVFRALMQEEREEELLAQLESSAGLQHSQSQASASRQILGLTSYSHAQLHRPQGQGGSASLSHRASGGLASLPHPVPISQLRPPSRPRSYHPLRHSIDGDPAVFNTPSSMQTMATPFGTAHSQAATSSHGALDAGSAEHHITRDNPIQQRARAWALQRQQEQSVLSQHDSSELQLAPRTQSSVADAAGSSIRSLQRSSSPPHDTWHPQQSSGGGARLPHSLGFGRRQSEPSRSMEDEWPVLGTPSVALHLPHTPPVHLPPPSPVQPPHRTPQQAAGTQTPAAFGLQWAANLARGAEWMGEATGLRFLTRPFSRTVAGMTGNSTAAAGATNQGRVDEQLPGTSTGHRASLDVGAHSLHRSSLDQQISTSAPSNGSMSYRERLLIGSKGQQSSISGQTNRQSMVRISPSNSPPHGSQIGFPSQQELLATHSASQPSSSCSAAAGPSSSSAGPVSALSLSREQQAAVSEGHRQAEPLTEAQTPAGPQPSAISGSADNRHNTPQAVPVLSQAAPGIFHDHTSSDPQGSVAPQAAAGLLQQGAPHSTQGGQAGGHSLPVSEGLGFMSWPTHFDAESQGMASLPPSMLNMGWEYPAHLLQGPDPLPTPRGTAARGAASQQPNNVVANAVRASAAAANIIGTEQPCRVRLRLWHCSAADPTAVLEVPSLTIPDAVLCSEMGVHFSACGRFLAACVACQAGHLQDLNPDASGIIYEVRVYSLEAGTLGQVLHSKQIKAAHCLTSVQFSPTSEHLLLAYGRRHISLLRSLVPDGTSSIIPVHTILEVYRVSDMSLVRVLPSAEDEVNAAAFHPHPGGGLAYGTKEGKLRILRHDPRPEARTLATCQQPRGLQDELREAESAYEDDVLL